MEAVLTAIGTVLTILGFMWAILSNFKTSMNIRFDKMDIRMTSLEHDMIEIKTILRMKECCMIKDDRQIKKAE